MANATRAAQDRTLTTARHNGEQWTQSELDAVHELDGKLTNEEIAKAVERTLYSISYAKRRAVEGRPIAPRGKSAPTLAWDRGFTDVEALFA